jgi:hypothetical protein
MEDYTGLFVFLGIVSIVICYIVGTYGKKRKIGFWGAFWASFFLSPILGMLFVLTSDKKEVQIKTTYIPKPVDPAILKAHTTKMNKTLLWLTAIFLILVAIIKAHI